MIFDVNHTEEIEKIHQTVVAQTQAYLKENGFKHAVLGLSGGLDSAVCAAILTQAIGAGNVYGVFMPSSITSNQSRVDALELVENLGINYFEIPIGSLVEKLEETTAPLFDFAKSKGLGLCETSFTVDNYQARARANIIWALANEFESTIVIATSDKSELYMGYATIGGDMLGGFAPIADVLKTQVFALAAKIPEIPKSILAKPPTAELALNPKTGETLRAEDALMPYAFMDEVILRLEDLAQNTSEMMKEEFYFERAQGISPEQKKLWLEKFEKRVRAAVFKWGLMPKSPKMSKNSLNTPQNFEKLKALFEA